MLKQNTYTLGITINVLVVISYTGQTKEFEKETYKVQMHILNFIIQGKNSVMCFHEIFIYGHGQNLFVRAYSG